MFSLFLLLFLARWWRWLCCIAEEVPLGHELAVHLLMRKPISHGGTAEAGGSDRHSSSLLHCCCFIARDDHLLQLGSLYPTVGRLKLVEVIVTLLLCYIVAVLSLVMIICYSSEAYIPRWDGRSAWGGGGSIAGITAAGITAWCPSWAWGGSLKGAGSVLDTFGAPFHSHR